MTFLSIGFAVWVAITVIVFHLLPARFRPQELLVASLAFYATHGLGYLVLLVALTLGTYRAALLIDLAATDARKRRILVVTVAGLILILCAFKLGGALALSHRIADVEDDTAWRFLLPLGLSYYLFKLVSYLLEVYWENLPAQRSPMVLCLYASFFPQIVCGPIQRPGPFFEQLARGGQVEPEDLTAGLRLILFGLFKKIAIADRLGPAVAAIHSAPELHSSLELLFGAYAFAIQLYADFSGLTDIALGIGRLLGIKGPENFSLPFFARNLQDYWRRWHMSLTTWLADYLFTPLRMGLRDLGRFGLAAAVFLNMVAIGVWHGFSGPYLAFGVYHGVALAASMLTLKRRDHIFKAHPAFAQLRGFVAPLLTFHLVVFGMILFRAASLQHAVRYLSSMATGLFRSDISPLRFQLDDMPTKLLVSLSMLVVVMEIAHFTIRTPAWRERFRVTPRVLRWAMYYGLILTTLSFSRFGEENFIYGQF